MPSTSPARTSNETCRTACTTPSSVGKSTPRSVTLSSGLRPARRRRGLARRPTRPRSCRPALTLTRFCRGSNASRRPSPMKFTDSEISTMNRNGNQNSQGSVTSSFLFSLMISPSDASGPLHAQPDERQRRLQQHRLGDRDGRVHDDHVDRVGQDVPEHDARGRRAGGQRRLHELLLAQREHHAADGPGDRQPGRGERQDQRHRQPVAAGSGRAARRSCCGPARPPRPAAGRPGSGRSAGSPPGPPSRPGSRPARRAPPRARSTPRPPPARSATSTGCRR